MRTTILNKKELKNITMYDDRDLRPYEMTSDEHEQHHIDKERKCI